MSQNSIVDKFLQQQEEQQKQKEVVIENEREYRVAINRIFKKNEGKLLAKYMFKFSRMLQPYTKLNPAEMAETAILQAFYLKMIRPYLEPEIRMEIENL